jgi:membrane protein implicated in regulation of membrane protease activity
MLQDLFSSGFLNFVYAAIVLISFLFALFSLIGMEVGDALDFDADTDGGFDLLSVSPFGLAMFGAAFGLAGLISRLWLDMEAIPSILVATFSGLVIGGLAQAFFLYFLSPSRSSHYSLEQDAVGREAEVTITIPAEGLGQIAFNNVSGRVTVGARSATDERISSGDLVIIEKIVGRVAQVRPAGDD